MPKSRISMTLKTPMLSCFIFIFVMYISHDKRTRRDFSPSLIRPQLRIHEIRRRKSFKRDGLISFADHSSPTNAVEDFYSSINRDKESAEQSI